MGRLVALASMVALAATAGQVQPLTPAAAATSSAGWLHTSGSKILTAAGTEHTIKSVNWFGMETTNCAPHGLWKISLDAGLTQIAGMGFNTVRLPYSNECLRGAPVSGVDTAKNPLLANKSSQQVMDVFVARAEAHGLSVILDRHRPSSAAQSDLWYTASYSEQAWISDWVKLAKRYATSPTVIGVDLHNEPAGAACWGCGNPATDWAAAATRGGNAVLAANPKLLVVVEGVEKQGNGEHTWWGGGLADAAARPVTLAVSNRLVYSTHDYPASVFPQKWFTAVNYPANLPGQWDKTWGYLHKQGTAPILIGEFGTKLETVSDQRWLDTLVNYLKTNKMSFSYWSFNPNSGDTGGLVKDDWVTPQTAKLAKLAPLLKPAITATVTPKPPLTPTPTPKPTPTPTPTPTPKPTTTPAPSAAGMTATWKPQSSWREGYVTQITVKAGSTRRDGWTLSWSDPQARSAASAWGMTCSVAAHRVTCHGSDWGRTIAAGSSVTAGVHIVTADHGSRNPQLTVS